MRFIDSNAVIYAYDSSNVRKQSIAQTLLAEGLAAGDAVISKQVLGEFLFLTVNRKRLLTADEAEEAIRALSRLKTLPIDAPMVRGAVQNHRRYQLRYWDALIVASAQRAGCAEIVTEDLSDGQDYGGVVARNPFRDEG